jgi:hypothetical protein
LEGKRDGGENAKAEENPPQGPHRFGSLRERGEDKFGIFFFLPIDCSCVKRYIRANNIYLSFIFLSFYFPSSSPLPTEI